MIESAVRAKLLEAEAALPSVAVPPALLRKKPLRMELKNQLRNVTVWGQALYHSEEGGMISGDEDGAGATLDVMHDARRRLARVRAEGADCWRAVAELHTCRSRACQPRANCLEHVPQEKNSADAMVSERCW